MAERSSDSTEPDRTDTDTASAGASPAGSTGGDAATEQISTQRDRGSSTEGGGSGDATNDAAAGPATRPVRSVPGGAGVPGRAAPRRVLRADEPMPGETAPAGSGGSEAGSAAPAAGPGGSEEAAGSAGSPADESPTTTMAAQPDPAEQPTLTGRSTGGAQAWSAASTEQDDTAATTRMGGDGYSDRGDGYDDRADGYHDRGDGGSATTAMPAAAMAGGAVAQDDHPDVDPRDGDRRDDDRGAEPKVRRGTGDLGLLVLRLALGAGLLAHGLQKLPGLFGGSGIDGYEQLLTDGGFQRPGILAYVGAVSEIGAGGLLILGLLTPIAAAAAIGVLVNAWFFVESSSEAVFPYFAGQGGAELELALLAMAVTVALAGPGRAALDARRRWATRPTWDGIAAVLIGGGAGAAVWFLLNGANPFG